MQKKLLQCLEPNQEEGHCEHWFKWLDDTGKITSSQHRGLLRGEILFKMPPNLMLIPDRKRLNLLNDLANIPSSPYFQADEEAIRLLDLATNVKELRALVKRVVMEALK